MLSKNTHNAKLISYANVVYCRDFISPASSVINRRRDSEYAPHHSINLGTRIHTPNHVCITTPCFVHVLGRLNDGESLL